MEKDKTETIRLDSGEIFTKQQLMRLSEDEISELYQYTFNEEYINHNLSLVEIVEDIFNEYKIIV